MTPRMRQIVQQAQDAGIVDMHSIKGGSSGFIRSLFRDLERDGYLRSLPWKSGKECKRYAWTGKPLGPPAPKPSKAEPDGTTVRFKASLTSRKRMFDPSQTAVVTKRTKVTICPSSPVYSNVQVAPGEKVPALWSSLPYGKYPEE